MTCMLKLTTLLPLLTPQAGICIYALEPVIDHIGMVLWPNIARLIDIKQFERPNAGPKEIIELFKNPK